MFASLIFKIVYRPNITGQPKLSVSLSTCLSNCLCTSSCQFMYTSLPICLSIRCVHLSVHSFLNQYAHQSDHLFHPLSLSLCQFILFSFVCPSVHPFVCLSISPSVLSFVCPSICPYLCPSICLVRLSIHLPIRLFFIAVHPSFHFCCQPVCP
jgi:hypothetical protein